MPWPDFSELTFGYAFLSEFERTYTYGGRYPTAPTFISQHEEARCGHDVEIALSDGTPVFIQLKRSFVVETANAVEGRGSWTFPSYRMYLRKNRNYDQHRKLRRHEQEGQNVLYVTSRVKDRRELIGHYARATMVPNGSQAFAPSSIPTPIDADQHWVSFGRNGWPVRRYSTEPIEIDDPIQNLAEHFKRLRTVSADRETNMEKLEAFCKIALQADPQAEMLTAELGTSRSDISPTLVAYRKASLIAQMSLDAKLVVLPRKAIAKE